MEREIIELETDVIVDIYREDNKDYKLMDVITPNYISDDDSNQIDIVFKRLSDGKFFGTEISAWGDENYECDCEVKEVYSQQKTITVYV